MENEMTCKELVELVTDYLEGTLPDDDHMRLESHLSRCDGCTNYVEQMRQTIRLTGHVQEESLTPQEREDLLTLFRDWKKN
jgi:predicted anti-sigma-YlaC factor YlaD